MEMILRHYTHVSKSKMFKIENITEFKQQQQQKKNTGKLILSSSQKRPFVNTMLFEFHRWWNTCKSMNVIYHTNKLMIEITPIIRHKIASDLIQYDGIVERLLIEGTWYGSLEQIYNQQYTKRRKLKSSHLGQKQSSLPIFSS